MSKLEDRLAALAARDDATAPTDEGEKDAAAALFWPVSASDPDAALLIENNERERRLYPGRMLQDKRILQKLGWSVWYCTERGAYAGKATNWLRVGEKIIPAAELRPMADRHMRAAREDI